MTSDAPILILLAKDGWPPPCRFGKVAKHAGFQVMSIGRRSDPVHLSQYIDKRLVIADQVKAPQQWFKALSDILGEHTPDILIPCDEASIHLLNAYYAHLEDQGERDLADLISKMRGKPEFFETIINKHTAIELAYDLKIPVPAQTLCESVQDVQDFVTKVGVPFVAKSEIGSAGTAVRICQDEAEIEAVYSELNQNGQMIVQQYIQGKPAMANAAALNGEMLACATFIKEECYPDEKGPSAVVRHIDHKTMKKSAAAFIKHIGYSGILSLDFMLDSKKQAYMIECNPRPVPVSHLGPVTGIDLFKALYAGVIGANYKPEKFKEKMIALFPKELKRDSNSSYLYEAHHDVPWDEPRILEYLLSIAYKRTT